MSLSVAARTAEPHRLRVRRVQVCHTGPPPWQRLELELEGEAASASVTTHAMPFLEVCSLAEVMLTIEVHASSGRLMLWGAPGAQCCMHA